MTINDSYLPNFNSNFIKLWKNNFCTSDIENARALQSSAAFIVRPVHQMYKETKTAVTLKLIAKTFFLKGVLYDVSFKLMHGTSPRFS